ncbi:MAG: DNRLRE domain-containing protein [Promethearchaeota archaeon]|nr:MAG: DNRLRE domain-containing protein [Candidatus Lokiarchaeota archaeon]
MKIIVLSLFILELFIGLTVVIGDDDDDDDDANEADEETEAEMDSYVYQSNPDSNYGGYDYLRVGGPPGRYVTYIYFDFDDEPDDWKEVEISLDLFEIDETMDVNLFEASSVWEELTITWNNRPAVGGLIETFKASSEGNYKFDVSDQVEDLLDDDEEGIAICLNLSSTYTGFGDIYMYSEEGAYYGNKPPLLIWTYDLTVNVDYGMIVFLILIILIPIVTVSVLLILYFTIWRKKAPRKPVVPPKDVVTPTQPSRAEPSPTPTSIKICANCGERIPPNSKTFCPNCGNKILQEKIEFCPSCGNKVPPNANFCEKCGNDID